MLNVCWLTLLSVAGHSHSCLGWTGLYGSEQNFSPAHCKPPGPQNRHQECFKAQAEELNLQKVTSKSVGSETVGVPSVGLFGGV